MPLTPAQTLASIAVMAVVTFLTRALPFILFAGLAAVLLHLWKGNDLISIFGATVFYMVLVQGVFG